MGRRRRHDQFRWIGWSLAAISARPGHAKRTKQSNKIEGKDVTWSPRGRYLAILTSLPPSIVCRHQLAACSAHIQHMSNRYSNRQRSRHLVEHTRLTMSDKTLQSTSVLLALQYSPRRPPASECPIERLSPPRLTSMQGCQRQHEHITDPDRVRILCR